MEPGDEQGAEPPLELIRPAVVDDVFGVEVTLADRYVHHLADTGVSHGLIGPRERPRLWERHVLNCAAVAELIPAGSRVADVGSGAGLPGVVLAIARPDLQVTLIEPLLRRVGWLTEVLDDLALPNVELRRARAEQLWDEIEVDVVTSRAVARLEELARLSLPLLRAGGTMLALKGSSAVEELSAAQSALVQLGIRESEVVCCGGELLEHATIVTRLVLGGRAQRLGSDRTTKKKSSGRAARRHRGTQPNRR
ncbi:16S rRNA (guanine(527)-N(7))-methyltransferase RsmG [Leekyejoonella antrihumi]|uniref:16S rRNA (guanine(527)-N(7))-methyltransferase RsmG n=1 Tax=Leekyejoonella antrihumi TaxID=1660198 RepID=UPI00319EA57F